MSAQDYEEFKQKIIIKLRHGDYPGAECEFYRAHQAEATQRWHALLTDVSKSGEARAAVQTLRAQRNYRELRQRQVTITTLTGDRIRVPSWYALKEGKKRGRKKKGPNGRGDHLLLRFWGFVGKQSLNYAMQVARCGVSCLSYELASTELKERAIALSAKGVHTITQKVGGLTATHRSEVAVAPGETLAGKRVMVAIDGGRVRMRENKPGRYALTQTRAKFEPAWREPKLIVIAELDEQGNKRKDAPPLYEGTMGDHTEIFALLTRLAQRLRLQDAREIVCSGDGAAWIWEGFQQLARQFNIAHKVTEILDFYHATEHLTAIADACLGLTGERRKQWFEELKNLLRAGRFADLRKSIAKESQAHPKLVELWQYFERNRGRMRYDVYAGNRQPIGSGIVESAVRRVINLKLKSPGTFWNEANLERVLQLRCILMAGRWQTMVRNVLGLTQFQIA